MWNMYERDIRQSKTNLNMFSNNVFLIYILQNLIDDLHLFNWRSRFILLTLVGDAN